MEDLRGAPLNVANLEEIIDEKCAAPLPPLPWLSHLSRTLLAICSMFRKRREPCGPIVLKHSVSLFNAPGDHCLLHCRDFQLGHRVTLCGQVARVCTLAAQIHASGSPEGGLNRFQQILCFQPCVHHVLHMLPHPRMQLDGDAESDMTPWRVHTRAAMLSCLPVRGRSTT